MSRDRSRTVARSAGVEGVLRHPDGSVDIAAYARLAHRERRRRLLPRREKRIRMVREMVSVIRRGSRRSQGPSRLPESITRCGDERVARLNRHARA